MNEVKLCEMAQGQWYYIESKKRGTSSGSGRQTGCFDHIDGDVAHFSKITDIRRPDGTMGRSGLTISGDAGMRHTKWFGFYQPMEELIMRRALVRREICKTRQIDCDAEDYIAVLPKKDIISQA